MMNKHMAIRTKPNEVWNVIVRSVFINMMNNENTLIFHETSFTNLRYFCSFHGFAIYEMPAFPIRMICTHENNLIAPNCLAGFRTKE